MTRMSCLTFHHPRSGTRKVPVPLVRLPGPRLALQSVGAVLLAAGLLQGCLVPQSIDPATSRLHQPPRISVQNIPIYLLGPTATLQRSSLDPQGCSCNVALSVPVILDDDPLATLEARWFLDYDPAGQPLTQRPIRTELIPGSFDATAVERRGLKPLIFDVKEFGITGDGYHVVDVVIAEQDGFDKDNTTLRNRALKPGYESTEHRFVVNVTTNNNARCPTVLPSTLTCAGGAP
ncbi:MAG: hypothetical protein NVS2B9_10490 [Myxococcales bacterium]